MLIARPVTNRRRALVTLLATSLALAPITGCAATGAADATPATPPEARSLTRHPDANILSLGNRGRHTAKDGYRIVASAQLLTQNQLHLRLMPKAPTLTGNQWKDQELKDTLPTVVPLFYEPFEKGATKEPVKPVLEAYVAAGVPFTYSSTTPGWGQATLPYSELPGGPKIAAIPATLAIAAIGYLAQQAWSAIGKRLKERAAEY